MKTINALFLTIILLISTGAMAYDFGAGTIDLPEGFAGPEKKQVRDQGMIHEFSKQHPGTDAATLLQITVYDFGQKLRPVPDSMMLAAAEDHLMDYIAGLRRHFDTFDFKRMPSLKIDGTPTAHIEWTGNSEGRQLHGTAYCLMKNSRVLTFQVRDASEVPLDNTIAALKALAGMKLKD